MDELFRNSLPFFLPALLPAIALLLAPSLGRRGRTLWAAGLALIAVGFVVDVLAIDHSEEYTLEVPNVFRRFSEGDAGETHPHRWIVDTVKAPAWHWHIATTVFMGLAALFLFVRRGRAPAPPPPVAAAVGVSLFYLAYRLALEKTAAPEAITWAVGVTPASVVILPFFAWHCGRSAWDFKRFVKNLLYMALLQRVAVAAVGYFATTRALGTHLDVHLVTDIALPLAGERKLASPLEAWVWTTLVPQLTLWLVFTAVIGLALGALPWWLARRRARAPAAT